LAERGSIAPHDAGRAGLPVSCTPTRLARRPRPPQSRAETINELQRDDTIQDHRMTDKPAGFLDSRRSTRASKMGTSFEPEAVLVPIL
jgi:hypothetical protein